MRKRLGSDSFSRSMAARRPAAIAESFAELSWQVPKAGKRPNKKR